MHLLPFAVLCAPDAPLRPEAPIASRCGHCAMRAAGVDCNGVTKHRVKQRHALYHQGDACHAIYAVCSGTLKSSLANADGTERVIGFPVPGELLGLDGSVEGSYTTTAIALEDSELCSIAPSQFAPLSAAAGLGREVLRMQQLLMLLGKPSADARLAQFLLNHALQLSLRGYSAHDFELRMSRADLGSFLGLSLETVSRSFSALRRLGVLEVNRRTVRIADLDGLALLVQSTQNRKLLAPSRSPVVSYPGVYQIRARPVISAVIST